MREKLLAPKPLGLLDLHFHCSVTDPRQSYPQSIPIPSIAPNPRLRHELQQSEKYSWIYGLEWLTA